MGPQTPRRVWGHLPLSVLGVWQVGGRGGRRPAAHHQRRAHLLSLQGKQRILERSAGEGLRQVSKLFLFVFLHKGRENISPLTL